MKKPSVLEKQFIRHMVENAHHIHSHLLRQFPINFPIHSRLRFLVTQPFKAMRRNWKWNEPHTLREVDFSWPRIKLGIEIQGGIFGDTRRSRQGHASKAGFISDYSKFNDMQLTGWTLILLTPEDVTKNWKTDTLPTIIMHLTQRIKFYHHAQLL